MDRIPNITESELKIMNILWEEYPLTSNEIIDKLDGYNDWSCTTIRTFISRLVNKSAIRIDITKKDYLYYPNISHKNFLKKQNKSFLNTVYNGSCDLLFKYLIEDDSITDEELDKFEKIIEKKKDHQL